MIEINHAQVFGLFHTIVEQRIKESTRTVLEELEQTKQELSQFFGENIDFEIVEDDPPW